LEGKITIGVSRSHPRNKTGAAGDGWGETREGRRSPQLPCSDTNLEGKLVSPVTEAGAQGT
jgi:hypothetical protein